MANERNGNTWYIDSTGALGADRDVLVAYVIVTATSANAVVALGDQVTGANKLNLRVPTAGSSVMFDFSRIPARFPNSIQVQTLTNAIATLVMTRQGG